MFDVMNCQAVSGVDEAVAKISKLYGEGESLLEPKYDGFRILAKIGDERVSVWTRAKKDNTGKAPYIEEGLAHVFGPGTVVDGEFVALRVVDGSYVNDFAHVQSIMLSLPDRAQQVARLTKRPLDYIIFDILEHEGNDLRALPYGDRRELLAELIAAKPHARIAHTIAVSALQYHHDSLVSLGFEGSVVKSVLAPYLPGDRGKGWYKIKAQPEVDVVITGFNEGKGKFDEMIGSVTYGQHDDDGNLVERGQCSGMDDDTRAWITAHQAELVGTVMSIKHMGVLTNGGFRHPQFSRFRPDRAASDVHLHDR